MLSALLSSHPEHTLIMSRRLLLTLRSTGNSSGSTRTRADVLRRLSYTPGRGNGSGFDEAVNPVHSTLVPFVIEQTVSSHHPR